MEVTPLERVLGNLAQLVPVIHRTLGKSIFRTAWEGLGEDISRHHFEVMKKLHDSGTLHMTEIADDLLISRPQMTRLIDEMVDLGMVERQSNEVDRRRVNVRLTAKGRKTVERFDALLIEAMSARLGSISDSELQELSSTLERLRDVLSRTQ
jgi:DNA-binding MarR family transcriptional regulator